MYAITDTGFRAIASEGDVQDGERFALELPDSLLLSLRIAEARNTRSALLRACDWTQIPDNSLNATERAAFAAYRQALRDLPQRSGFPDVDWPTAPVMQSGAGNETGETS